MKSIRKKLTIYFSGIILVICIIFTIISINSISGAVENQAIKKLDSQASNISEIISNKNENNYIYLEGIASRNKIFESNISMDEKMILLKNEVTQSDRFFRIAIADLNGNTYSSDSYFESGQAVDISERDYFSESIEGNRGIMNPVISKNSEDNGALIMAYSVPIYENNQVSGVLVALADACFLNEMTDEMHFGETGYVYIVDSTGTLISHPDRDNVTNQMNLIEAGKTDSNYQSMGGAVQKAIDLDKGFGEYQLDNTDYYLSYSKVEGMDWTVLISMSKDEILSALPGLILGNSIVSIIILLLSIVICYFIANKISKRIQQVNHMIKEMGMGHLGIRLDLESNDEIGEMAQAMDDFAENLQTVLIGTMNQIAEGDLSTEITVVDNDDEITPPLKQMIESLRGLVKEANDLSEATVEGQLSKRADTEKYQGVYKEIVEGMNNTLDAVIIPLKRQATFMDRISKGAIPPKFTETLNGDYEGFRNSFNNCIEAINLMVSDVNLLVEAGIAGNLSVRADSEKHQGDYKNIIAGVNKILETIIEPLNMSANAIDNIGKGIIPEKITEDFNGDYNTIKNNINACVDGLGALEEAKIVLRHLSLNDFTQKIGGDYLGIYGEIAESINAIQYKLTHILGMVNHVSIGDMSDYDELKKTGKQSDEDEMTPSFIQMIWNINTLVTETDDIVLNAVAGEFDYRGNAMQLPGAYAKVIDGFNETLDVIIAPIKEASETLRELSEGNLSAAMIGDYQGQHAVIKNDLNQTIQFLKGIINEISETLEQVGDGNLNQ